MGKNPGFRAWFYFRQGWSVYFAFVFAAINMLTVTYFLAIENYPTLKEVFPSFEQYILIVALIGVPLLASVGYAHYKKPLLIEQKLMFGWKVIHIGQEY